MKEIEKVSISGIAFMLDIDAYQALDNYLGSLRAAYRNEPDAPEIIADIEARIAELILARQDASKVVDRPLIEGIVAQMGAPEVDPTTAPLPDAAFPRRLYRNKEGAKLGGVCSGIATFFDIDPVWVRLSVFAPLVALILAAPMGGHFWNEVRGFLGMLIGVFFLLYFLLWIVVPMARSPRQKLEARGERITASSIENSLRREFADTRRAVQAGSVWGEVFVVVGRICLFGLKAIALIVGLSLALAAISLAAGIVYALFGWGSMELGNGGFAYFVGSIDVLAPHLYIALMGLVGLLPVVALTWMLFCFIFERPLRGRVLSILMAVWLVLAIVWGGLSLRGLQRYESDVRNGSDIDYPTRGYRIERTIPAGEPTPFDSITAASHDSTAVVADTLAGSEI